ncbi:MAG: hypothetical protein A2V66_11940 [Ignavibacteria bacterium RBG_13_36_8]|nr:MAG: hypothetical protein A2V66_11940 [Ignavibacteria bacterium RBG_13_36_8]
MKRPSVTVLCNRNVVPGTHIHAFKDKVNLDKFLKDETVQEHIKLGFLSVKPINDTPVDIKTVEEERSIGLNIDNTEKPSDRKIREKKERESKVDK